MAPEPVLDAEEDIVMDSSLKGALLAEEAPPVNAEPGLKKTSAILDEIQALKKTRADMKNQKMLNTKKIRAAEKQRARLMRRAKQLNQNDLMDVYVMRSLEAAARRKNDTSSGSTTAE